MPYSIKLLHHPMPNILSRTRNDLPSPWNEIQESYPEFPSVKIAVDGAIYLSVCDFITQQTDAKCVHFDGEAICIPAYYPELVHYIQENYAGKVIATDAMKEYEFTTLAIKAGITGDLVAIGTAIFGLDGSAADMLKKALHSPAETLSEWKRLYQDSMSPH